MTSVVPEFVVGVDPEARLRLQRLNSSVVQQTIHGPISGAAPCPPTLREIYAQLDPVTFRESPFLGAHSAPPRIVTPVYGSANSLPVTVQDVAAQDLVVPPAHGASAAAAPPAHAAPAGAAAAPLHCHGKDSPLLWFIDQGNPVRRVAGEPCEPLQPLESPYSFQARKVQIKPAAAAAEPHPVARAPEDPVIPASTTGLADKNVPSVSASVPLVPVSETTYYMNPHTHNVINQATRGVTESNHLLAERDWSQTEEYSAELDTVFTAHSIRLKRNRASAVCC